MSISPIYVVSGGEGTSGERVVQTILAQFETNIPPEVIIMPHVRDTHQLEDIVSKVQRTQGTIVHTLVDAGLRQELNDLARRYNVAAIDLMGGLLTRLTTVMAQEPLGQPGLYHKMQESQFARSEAINFAVRHDDGKRPQELDRAEIILVGVSRVGKTPLSMYLAVQGWKVANIPLIPDSAPPEELFAVDPGRVVGLVIDPEELMAFRRWRKRQMNLPGPMAYTDPLLIYEQIEAARKLYRRGGFAILDITDRPIEESAAEIIALITRRTKK